MKNLYIGINSGTSIDHIDCGLFSFDVDTVQTIATHSIPFPTKLASFLKAISSDVESKILLAELGQSQTELATLYSNACRELLQKHTLKTHEITAIGCHGQTIYHSPFSQPSYTIQLNNGAVIAHNTGIDTVVDFRSADMASGGQGAPLAPVFHYQFLLKDKPTAIVNLGGIANLTLLNQKDSVIGYDTGPANCLMDMWVQKHFNLAVDHNGEIAKSGTVIKNLLAAFFSDSYFQKPYPKSSGVDYFNLHWLDKYLAGKHYTPENVVATLCELTAQSVTNEIHKSFPAIQSVFVCGGGANNTQLLNRINFHLPDITVSTTSEYGIDPEWVECALFAWLAKMHIEKQSINLSSITGSTHPVILGAYYPAIK